MQGHPNPGMISAEQWELFNLIVRKVAAHRSRELRRRR